MRLVTYDASAGPRVGVLDGDAVRDAGFDGGMVAFIEAGAPARPGEPVEGARLLAPLRPRSLRDFLAFEGHMKNALSRLGRPIPDEWYEVPAYYKGMPDTVIGPDAEVPWPSFTDKLDHELELAAVIGRRVKDVAPEDAAACIFGYTIWNDLSARDVQARELPVGMGPGKAKDWDGSNVLGPVHRHRRRARRLRPRHARARERRAVGRGPLVEHAPHLRRHDRLRVARPDPPSRRGAGSGTAPGGSGLELDRWLAPGDVVELEIEGIGVLRNRIGRKGGT